MELTLFVEHQCNLRCTYCYTGEKFTRRMSSETMRKAVGMALATRPEHMDLSVFGGEPLLRVAFLRETFEHVEARIAAMPGPRPSLRFIVNTNATLVNDEVIELLSAPRRVTVFVSLDGPRDLHDKRRLDVLGRGSFARVREGIARLKQAGIRFQIVSVVHEASAHRLGEVLEAALELGPEKLTLSPNYADSWTAESIARLERGLDDLAGRWIAMFRRGERAIVDPLHTKILNHVRSANPCSARCLLAAGELTVAPSGRLYPCAQMVGEDDRDELVIGHVDTGLDRAAAARLQSSKDRVESVCAECDLRERCQSHCGCKHVALTGELGSITAALCETEAAFVAAADKVAETLYAESNPEFLSLYYRRAWQPAAGAELVRLRASARGRSLGAA